MTDKKVALVTGGSRGIGRACAIELAKAGCDVVINYAGNAEAAAKTVEELKALGSNSESFKFDVSVAPPRIPEFASFVSSVFWSCILLIYSCFSFSL